MRLLRLVLICFLFPIAAMAQSGMISGRVTGKDTKLPIARASVFLSNSSFGTITSVEGDFTLSSLRPGQYTLVVTAIGYAEFIKTVLVSTEPIKLDVQLEQKVTELREVIISSTSRADWNRNYTQFKTEFIGSDANARSCDVTNPQVLSLSYKRSKQTLTASSNDFLVVENRALGYRVKFLLKDFKSDKIEGTVSYEGQRLFEELPGSEAQKKKWRVKRDLAYYGSAMHFLRSLYTNKLQDEGFEARRLIRLPNPERPPEALIQKRIAQYRSVGNRDSAIYWINLGNLSKYGKQRLSSVPWLSLEILRTTDQAGIYALTFPDNLHIVYTKKREDITYKDIYRPLDMPNYETTIVTLFNNPPYAVFDMNGIVIGESPMYEGAWSKARLSELLPVDYVPSAPPAVAVLNN